MRYISSVFFTNHSTPFFAVKNVPNYFKNVINRTSVQNYIEMDVHMYFTVLLYSSQVRNLEDCEQ